MSILINGMEMQNNCRDCPLEDTYEGYNCRIVGKPANWGLEGRPSWCPLIPVPPHGRLIDADKIAEGKFVSVPHVTVNGNEAGMAYRLGWNTAIEAIIENAETVIGGE